MPSAIQLTETAPATENTPSSGKDLLFFDNTGQLCVKNSAGNSRATDNNIYKTIHEANFTVPAGTTAGTVLPNTNGVKSGTDITTTLLPTIRLASADLGLGAKLRVVFGIFTNATAPAITFTGGLYAVTFAGGAAAFVPTLGTVTPGSNGATSASPAASSNLSSTGQADFAATAIAVDPSNYCLGLALSGTTAASSLVKVSMQLQQRNT